MRNNIEFVSTVYCFCFVASAICALMDIPKFPAITALFEIVWLHTEILQLKMALVKEYRDAK